MEKERLKIEASGVQAKTSTRVSVPVPVVAQPSSSPKPLLAVEEAGQAWEAIGAAKATQQSLAAAESRVRELEQQLSVSRSRLSDATAERARAAPSEAMAEEKAVEMEKAMELGWRRRRQWRR